MTRIIALCLMLFATPAWAAGAWSPGSIPAGSCSTFTWTSTDAGDAQPPLLVLAGELAITAEVTSGTPSVAFYLIKGANGSDTPASTGTLAYTATATSRSPTYVSTGGGYVLDPDIDTAGAAGGTVTVCSAGYANAGRNPVRSAAVPPPTLPVDALSCDATNGCTNPRGAWLIDEMVFWSNFPGGVYDINGSNLRLSGVDSGVADATTDHPYQNTTQITSAQAIAAYTVDLTQIVPQSAANDQLFCRDNATFLPCSDSGATCVTSPTGGTNAYPMAFRRASTTLVYPVAVSSYAGCNSATPGTPSLHSGLPFATTTSDTFGLAMYDEFHPFNLYARWLAQTILGARSEAYFIPKANLISNGTMETACSGGAWQASGTATLATAAWQGADYYPGSQTSVYGSGCKLTGRLTGSGLQGPATAAVVQPGEWYEAHLYVSLNSITNTETIKVEFTDGVVPTAYPAANQTCYHNYGSDYVVMPSCTSINTGTTRECWGWCHIVIKGQVPATATPTTTLRLRITAVGTANMNVDQVYLYKSPYQSAGLHYIIPDGVVTFAGEMDSRSTPQTIEPALSAELDIVAATVRPKLILSKTFASSIKAVNGIGPSNVAAAGTTGITALRPYPHVGLIWLGVNDTTDDTSLATTLANYRTMFAATKAVGSIPIVMGEIPLRGATANAPGNNQCNISGGANTANCADLLQQLFLGLLEGFDFN